MIRNINKIRNLWLILALLSLSSALIGVINPDIYDNIVNDENITGVLSQDIITVVISFLALLLVFKIKKGDTTKEIILLGITGYLFYGYGIYVIEQFYNIMYFAYMTIFSLSVYSIIYFILNIRKDILDTVQLSKNMRITSIVFLLISPILFIPLWVSHLLPLIQSGQKLEFLYSIYILDLCFIMPAFIIIAIMTAKNNSYGLLLSPALFIKVFTLLSSVALGGILKLFQSQSVDRGEIIMYLFLSTLFFVITFVYFRRIRINYKFA
jgi:hypothetical protein